MTTRTTTTQRQQQQYDNNDNNGRLLLFSDVVTCAANALTCVFVHPLWTLAAPSPMMTTTTTMDCFYSATCVPYGLMRHHSMASSCSAISRRHLMVSSCGVISWRLLVVPVCCLTFHANIPDIFVHLFIASLQHRYLVLLWRIVQTRQLQLVLPIALTCNPKKMTCWHCVHRLVLLLQESKNCWGADGKSIHTKYIERVL